jgi:hypothetical protein
MFDHWHHPSDRFRAEAVTARQEKRRRLADRVDNVIHPVRHDFDFTSLIAPATGPDIV